MTKTGILRQVGVILPVLCVAGACEGVRPRTTASLPVHEGPQSVADGRDAVDGEGPGPAGEKPGTDTPTSLPTPLPTSQPVQTVALRNAAIHGTGYVTGVLVHPTEKSIYARTDVGGVFRLDRNASRWQPLTDDVGDWAAFAVDSFALDPTRPGTVYSAGGNFLGTEDAKVDGDIWKSADRGRTWTALGARLKDGRRIRVGGNQAWRSVGERLVVDPLFPSRLFWGSRTEGLLVSEDEGKTWAPVAGVPAGEAGVGVTWVLLDSSVGSAGAPTLRIYVGVARGGVYASSDGGASWARMGTMGNDTVPWHAVLDGRGHLYATFSDENGNAPSGGLVRFALNEATGPVALNPAGQKGCAGVTVRPDAPDTVVVHCVTGTALALFLSTDGGATWRALKREVSAPGYYPSWMLNEPIHSIANIAFDPHQPGRLYLVTGLGVFRTDDVQEDVTHWETVMEGFEELCVNEVLPLKAGPHAFVSAVWDMVGFVHADFARVPSVKLLPNEFGIASSLAHSERNPLSLAWVGSKQNNGVGSGRGGYSNDGGTTWQKFSTVPGGIFDGGVAVSSTDPRRMVWTGRQQAGPPFQSKTFYTKDAGTSWTESTGFSGAMYSIINPHSRMLEADPEDGMTFYGFNCGPGNGWKPTIFRSTDGGASFTELHPAGLPCGGAVNLRVMPGRRGEIWFSLVENGKSSGLFRSGDGGATFTRLAHLDEVRLYSFGANLVSGARVPSVYVQAVLGGVSGIYRSNDAVALAGDAAGATWTLLKSDDNVIGVRGFSMDGDWRVPGRIYFGLWGRGVLVGDFPAEE